VGGDRIEGYKPSGRWLNPLEREQAAKRLENGDRVADVAVAFGCSPMTIRRIRDEAQLRRRRAAHSGLRLSFAEREQISRGLAAGKSLRVLARGLGRAPSTISREVARSGGRRRYRALAAERHAVERLRRPKPTKLSRRPRLRQAVEEGLRELWSPAQISARLRSEYPDDEEMRISHETIYQSLYVQSRGELRRQLTANLRHQRTKRRPRARGLERRGRILGMVPIAERPPEVDSRAVPGHWEGDLLVGKRGRSFVATLVERHTRYVMLAQLGSEGTTERVIVALKERISELPRHLVLSLTWDQGRELAAHARFSEETGVSVYFCDPHSPWQRGSNENTNGLLRQYLPKGTDLSRFSQRELDEIAASLNGRPRQTLGWATPAEKMEELLR
jgi:IS30 family transposase